MYSTTRHTIALLPHTTTTTTTTATTTTMSRTVEVAVLWLSCSDYSVLVSVSVV